MATLENESPRTPTEMEDPKGPGLFEFHGLSTKEKVELKGLLDKIPKEMFGSRGFELGLIMDRWVYPSSYPRT